MKRRQLAPCEIEITSLGRGGVGIGYTDTQAMVEVRTAPPGSRMAIMPMGRAKGKWQARRTAMIRPPLEYTEPRCKVFGLCGGCALQELEHEQQQTIKAEYGIKEISDAMGVPIEHLRTLLSPSLGSPQAYGYRNRVELSFGVKRYLSEQDKAGGLPIEGRWLGFHAPGRFDRVVDAERCELVSEGINEIIHRVRQVALDVDAPMGWDPKTHQGFWRHLGIRETLDGKRLVAIYTAPFVDAEIWIHKLFQAVLAVEGVIGIAWYENGGVADVARGVLREQRGENTLVERLGSLKFQLSMTAFFQTNTRGAQVLYDAIGDWVAPGGTLLDLYCGVGSIGLYLADRFDHVLGIEEIGSAIDDARHNARLNGIQHIEFHQGKVEESLALLAQSNVRTVIVDPPRVGLHPHVAQALSSFDADILIYVACFPASLGRDAKRLEAGGWQLEALRFVDLFPHTGHVEAIGRFRRTIKADLE